MPTKNFRPFYRGLDAALEQLYQPDALALATGENGADFAFDGAVFERAAAWIHEKGGFTPDMLDEQPARAVIAETFRILDTAISSGISVEMPDDLVALLQNNAFVFSGLKTYHSLNEAGLSLIDKDGGIKPFAQFREDVTKIDEKYNRNYLYAEYNHAVTSSQMASKWHEFQQDGDRYDLQYRTAGDDKVREEHARLHDITLPLDDPFWEQFIPPNGWNCRCTVVQVRKGKYPTSDSARSVEIGEQVTADPKQKMFRFNPGIDLVVYPDRHPYNKAPRAVKETVAELAKEITTPGEAVEFVNASDTRRQWFERGFKSLTSTTKKGVNGYTDMNGEIALTRERLDNVLTGLTKLRRGGEVSFVEADALSTFWHEITHNRNTRGNMPLSKKQREQMELANELISRNTLSEFYTAFGSKLQHGSLQADRPSTGYNLMVRNYCSIIRETGANFDGVIRDVRGHLFGGDYDKQGDGLVKALINNGAANAENAKLKINDVKKLVRDCSYYREEHFTELLRRSLGK